MEVLVRIKDPNYWIISGNSNTDNWGQDVSPEWTSIGSLIYHPSQKTGADVGPHYHDADEVWMFATGRGEAWIDGHSYEITPNTVVCTPMGSVDRFQCFTEFDNASLVTRLERQNRPYHLPVEVEGPPVPTVPGFVVPGSDNNGPIASRGTRCPLSELRHVTLGSGDGVEESELAANEHWHRGDRVHHPVDRWLPD
jgi:mannose-6-phosphate isomerase-like protein (cupin superfamily)